MTPRLERLRHQRALLQEHLRWIDSEIAAEASALPEKDAAAATPVAAPPKSPAPPPPVADEAATRDTALPVPEADVRSIHSEVRSGCLLYFVIAFVALGAAVAFVYWRY